MKFNQLSPAKKTALVTMIAVLIVDQFSKVWLVGQLANNRIIEVTPFFKLVQVWNKGISFGAFNRLQTPEAQRGVLSILTVVIIFILLMWLKRTEKKLPAAALGLIIGGAIGNLLDRFHYGAVADFLCFHLGPHYWPAFNAADSCIVIGVGLILLDNFAGREKDPSARFGDQ